MRLRHTCCPQCHSESTLVGSPGAEKCSRCGFEPGSGGYQSWGDSVRSITLSIAKALAIVCFIALGLAVIFVAFLYAACSGHMGM